MKKSTKSTKSVAKSSADRESAIDRLNALYQNSNDGYFTKSASANLYSEGNSLFYNVTGQHLSNNFRGSEVNYSILPAPKYDETQENYRTAVAFTHTMYCIPIDAKNTDKSGAVLECMASEAYRNVTPALFETAFKYQYSKNPHDAATTLSSTSAVPSLILSAATLQAPSEFGECRSKTAKTSFPPPARPIAADGSVL